jgi:hypothetical protein
MGDVAHLVAFADPDHVAEIVGDDAQVIAMIADAGGEERPVAPVVNPPMTTTATPAPIPSVNPVRPAKPAPVSDVPDMEIPTFIRRQMD